MNRPLGLIALAAIMLAMSAAPLRAQSPATSDPAASQSQLTSTAQQLFRAIADGNVAQVKALTVTRAARRLDKDRLSVPAVGPKIHQVYDGKVRVLRQNSDSAVVQADFYAPDSTDIPPNEVRHLRIFMIKRDSDWKAASPNRREAGAEPFGGWYHPGSFTFCPNRGIEYLPNHFSSKLNDAETAVCR